jgi:hypothetical protein
MAATRSETTFLKTTVAAERNEQRGNRIECDLHRKMRNRDETCDACIVQQALPAI